MKKAFKVILWILAVIVILVAALLIYLSVREYSPEPRETAVVQSGDTSAPEGDTLRVASWNTGYSGLGSRADFVMDGGTHNGTPESEELYLSYSEGVEAKLLELDADVYLLQEVDADSTRSYGHDQVLLHRETLGGDAAFALNYSCDFVPFPWPPIGKVNSGVQTLSDYAISSAERVSLPCPFSWPLRVANLKRCLLVSRVDLPGTEAQLVLVNLHLEAYDSGEGKIAQTRMLTELLAAEYAAGNYVIAGGDFNQTFPGGNERYPQKDAELWMPGALSESDLPEGFRFAYDLNTPTCRLLNMPYDPADDDTQYYVIDGFIISDNLELISVETRDSRFEFSDHNPVVMEVRMIGEE